MIEGLQGLGIGFTTYLIPYIYLGMINDANMGSTRMKELGSGVREMRR